MKQAENSASNKQVNITSLVLLCYAASFEFRLSLFMKVVKLMVIENF